MGSHSVICYPTQVNTPRLKQNILDAVIVVIFNIYRGCESIFNKVMLCYVQIKNQSKVMEQLRADATTKTSLSEELSQCRQELEVAQFQLGSARQEMTGVETQLVQCRAQLETARQDLGLEQKKRTELTEQVWFSSIP